MPCLFGRGRRRTVRIEFFAFLLVTPRRLNTWPKAESSVPWLLRSVATVATHERHPSRLAYCSDCAFALVTGTQQDAHP